MSLRRPKSCKLLLLLNRNTDGCGNGIVSGKCGGCGGDGSSGGGGSRDGGSGSRTVLVEAVS